MAEDTSIPAAFIADKSLSGHRLDSALAALLPGASLRARRRLWDTGTVLVNGHPRPPGFTVLEGDSICLAAAEADPPTGGAMGSLPPLSSLPGNDLPRLLETRDGLLFLHKPAGLHSVSQPGGRGGPSLEDYLPRLLAAPSSASAATIKEDAATPSLLNRLDCGTSGLVLATCDTDAARRWREAENAGLCHKTYVALLAGTLPETVAATWALDTNKRRISRVLPEDAPALRHTAFQPLLHVCAEDVRGLAPWSPTLALCPADQPLTLALCRIRKGARHQIRAHAAALGFFLWGDGRYAKNVCSDASAAGEQTEHFILHHAMLQISGKATLAPCPWASRLPEKIANNITECLKKIISCPDLRGVI